MAGSTARRSPPRGRRGWTGSWSPARFSTRPIAQRRSANFVRSFLPLPVWGDEGEDPQRMTRIVLIHAGPTQWDVEGRLVGNHPLPLTEAARVAIERIATGLPDAVSAVHCFKKNEACHEAAKIVAR